MDHEALAKQLIRTLRGKRSQPALSRRLQYGSNVLYTWESGRRWPTAAIFFELAQRTNHPVSDLMVRFLGGPVPELEGRSWDDPATVAGFLRHLTEGTTIVELARRTGYHRVSVSRWLKGSAQPRLPEFLRLVDAASLRLLDFIALFTDPSMLPVAREPWRTLQAQREVAYGLPWSHAVLRLLELEAYRALPAHEEGWIARRLNLSLEEEARCLEALSRSKLIRRRKGQWVVSDVLTVDTRGNPEAGRRLKRHWASVGVERLPGLEPNQRDLFSYNLFTVSEADWERLRDLHIAYFLELRRIVETSAPAERVVLANVQLFRLDEPTR